MATAGDVKAKGGGATMVDIGQCQPTAMIGRAMVVVGGDSSVSLSLSLSLSLSRTYKCI